MRTFGVQTFRENLFQSRTPFELLGESISIEENSFSPFRFYFFALMPVLPTLFVQFENKLPAWQTPAFRGALIEKVGREQVAFHNHVGDTALVYRYPIIQYKSIAGKPSLLCVGQGVEEIHKLFGLRNWEVNIAGQEYDLKLGRMDMNQVRLGVWDKVFSYRIREWLALNEHNYERYQKTESLVERIALLERLLTGNILSFAKGIDWHVDKPIEVCIQELGSQRTIRYKGVPFLAFDVAFSCNIFLPQYLGLGKSASHGFGVVFSNSKTANF